MTLEESVEVTRLYSVCGLLGEHASVLKKRPFRAPHHTTTAAALTGGGRIPRPGEITLASKGILFLDDFGIFKECVRGAQTAVRRTESNNCTCWEQL